MRNLARIFACTLLTGILLGIHPNPVPAQESPAGADKSTLIYNEQVVQKLLEESDPDVAFLARLKMMEAHLLAAVSLARQGDLVEAREHITHPGSEILPDILSVLKSRNLKDPSPALTAALEAIDRGNVEDMEDAVDAAVGEIVLAEASIDPAKMVINGIVADVAVLLLRTAVAEYAEAFKYGKIVNIIEYHDGSAFVTEAAILIRGAEPQWVAQDAAAYAKLDQSLTELQTAWPGAVPPAKSIVALTKMLALVTIIELQINRIRAGV